MGKGNRLLQDNQFDYTFDDEGNLIRRTDRATGAYTDYVYDFRNRMMAAIQKTAANVETGRSEHSYDALNRRIRAFEGGQASYFGYDGLTPAFKFTATSATMSRRMYSRGLDGILADETAAQTRWFLTDQIGTVRDLALNTAGQVNHYSYDSFGRLLAETNPNANNDLLFAAREFDPQTGLAYFRARFYQSVTARFLSEDLVPPHDYTYAIANPLVNTDPFGLVSSEYNVTFLRAYQGLVNTFSRGLRYQVQVSRILSDIIINGVESVSGQASLTALYTFIRETPQARPFIEALLRLLGLPLQH